MRSDSNPAAFLANEARMKHFDSGEPPSAELVWRSAFVRGRRALEAVAQRLDRLPKAICCAVPYAGLILFFIAKFWLQRLTH
jgi:hypothetical protein